MQELRDRLVAEARTWRGTPYHWQASIKGMGSDCKGWLVGTARALGRPEGDSLEASLTGDHRVRVPVGELRKGLRNLFDKVGEARPGDILLLAIGHPARVQHLAMYVGDNRMIHCYKHFGVIEVTMGKAWWGALDSIWSWRDAR